MNSPSASGLAKIRRNARRGGEGRGNSKREAGVRTYDYEWVFAHGEKRLKPVEKEKIYHLDILGSSPKEARLHV